MGAHEDVARFGKSITKSGSDVRWEETCNNCKSPGPSITTPLNAKCRQNMVIASCLTLRERRCPNRSVADNGDSDSG